MSDLKQRAWKDFVEAGLPDGDWKAFWLGYVAAVRRFGGK